MPKRVIFVDDEPNVLAGLKRSLYGMRQEWEMEFVSCGQEALQAMEKQQFDIIVTDMRMPVMDGAQLLEQVRLKFPQCLRFVFSGQADRDSILKAVNPTHQFLSKPSEPAELKNRLTRALAIKNILQNEDLRGLVSKLESLPSLPTLYAELIHELNKSDPSFARIADLISEDMALTAKILQLVNSAFFGLPCHVSGVMKAVGLLGLDVIRAVVLSTHAFSKFQSKLLSEADMEYLWKHSFAVAGHAKKIAIFENADKCVVDECFTTGLLHDLGKLILASAVPDKYRTVLSLVKYTKKPLMVAELEILGCGHAEVAAYLLSMWGLPSSVVEGVAWQHYPSVCSQAKFSAVAATHVASICDEQNNPYWMTDGTLLDVEYLNKIGCAERELAWKNLVQSPPAVN
jgi:HD-like signal output (HDOD) protein/CheY-like chemotaxis protein